MGSEGRRAVLETRRISLLVDLQEKKADRAMDNIFRASRGKGLVLSHRAVGAGGPLSLPRGS